MLNLVFHAATSTKHEDVQEQAAGENILEEVGGGGAGVAELRGASSVKFGVITTVTENNNNNNIFWGMKPSSGRNLKTFTKNLPTLSSELNTRVAGSFETLANFSRPHGVTSRKTAFFRNFIIRTIQQKELR